MGGLASSADAAGAATEALPALTDSAVRAGSQRRPAAPDRPARPGSRRAPATGKQSRPAGRTQVLTRPSHPNRRAADAEDPAELDRRRDSHPGRRTGRRHSLKMWLLTGVGVLVLLGVAAVAVYKFLPRGPSGPEHSLTTPLRLGAFTRSSKLTKQMNVGAIERNIVAQSSGQASHLVSSVYEAGSPMAGGGTPAQVMLFIGGQLSGGSATTSVNSFTEHFRGAKRTGAGSPGGDAACVSAQAKGTGGQTVCAWFDNNTFGELVSPNMPVSALASELRSIRPDVEHVVK